MSRKKNALFEDLNKVPKDRRITIARGLLKRALRYIPKQASGDPLLRRHIEQILNEK